MCLLHLLLASYQFYPYLYPGFYCPPPVPYISLSKICYSNGCCIEGDEMLYGRDSAFSGEFLCRGTKPNYKVCFIIANHDLDATRQSISCRFLMAQLDKLLVIRIYS